MRISLDDHSFVPLEDIVSGPGLLRTFNKQVGSDNYVASAHEVTIRAKGGDEIARESINKIGWWLGLGLSHALHAYDAECVVVGGSVAQIGAPLFKSAKQSLSQHGHTTVAETPLIAAELGPQAQLVGAAEFARQKQV
jgi:glucokinase